MQAVQVYKNLHKGAWSIRCKGKVIAHASSVTLANVVFHVSESGRNRVIARKCREVHAWAIGELTEFVPVTEGTEVCYNPYRAATFTTRDGQPVTSAALVRFTEDNKAIAY